MRQVVFSKTGEEQFSLFGVWKIILNCNNTEAFSVIAALAWRKEVTFYNPMQEESGPDTPIISPYFYEATLF